MQSSIPPGTKRPREKTRRRKRARIAALLLLLFLRQAERMGGAFPPPAEWRQRGRKEWAWPITGRQPSKEGAHEAHRRTVGVLWKVQSPEMRFFPRSADACLVSRCLVLSCFACRRRCAVRLPLRSSRPGCAPVPSALGQLPSPAVVLDALRANVHSNTIHTVHTVRRAASRNRLRRIFQSTILADKETRLLMLSSRPRQPSVQEGCPCSSCHDVLVPSHRQGRQPTHR